MSSFLNELERQIREMWQFRINIFFANLSIILMIFSYIKYFENEMNPSMLFILMFCWYFATHGITHPTFFIEDELRDRTLISILQSRTSIFKILATKVMIQIILDMIKAIPVFLIIGYLINIEISNLCFYGVIILAVILSVISMYGVGLILSSFTLIFRRTSSVCGLISYAILFFGGILNSNVSNSKANYLLPFDILKLIVLNEDWKLILIIILQGVIYWIIGVITFNKILKIAKLKGSIFEV